MTDKTKGVLCPKYLLDFDFIGGLDNAVDVLKVVAKGLSIRKKAVGTVGTISNSEDKSTAFIEFKDCEIYLDYNGGDVYNLGLTRRGRPCCHIKACPIYKDEESCRGTAAKMAEWISTAVMSSHDALRHWDGFYVELMKKYEDTIENIQFKNGNTFIFTVGKGKHGPHQEFQLKVGFSEEHDSWSVKLHAIKVNAKDGEQSLELVHQNTHVGRKESYAHMLRGIEYVLSKLP